LKKVSYLYKVIKVEAIN